MGGDSTLQEAEAAMSRITLDPALLAHLINIKEPVEICDPDGKVVGKFTPAPREGPLEWGRPQLPEEELRRRDSRKEGRTWAEIRADLEKRG
jgi:hypothetical protein